MEVSSLPQFEDRPNEYMDTIVSVLAGIVMAIETQNWGYIDLEQWKKFFAPDPQEGIFMLAKQWSDPKNVELRKMLWTEIANDIETALHAG